MSVKLVMFDSQGQRKAFALPEAETVIGRAEDCGLRIPLLDVSRKHCQLTVIGEQIRLKDLGSTNGTYVNGRRINEAVLQPGDRVTIGSIVLTLQVNGVPQESSNLAPAIPEPDSEEAVLADIEAAIALGPDELEDSGDLTPIISPEDDPLTALESLELESEQSDAAERVDPSDLDV